MTPQSMNKIVASLLSRGYIASGKNLHDKRRKELYLTDQGSAAIHSIMSYRDRWIIERVDEILTVDEASQLAEALPLLRRLVDREAKAEGPAIPQEEKDKGIHP